MVSCLRSRPRLALSETACDFVRRSGKPPRLGDGNACRAQTLHRIRWNLSYKCGKSHGKSSIRVTEGRSVFSAKAIRLFDLVIAGDGLDWPALPCRPWLSRQTTGSTLVQLKYLTSCRNSGFHTSANIVLKRSVWSVMWKASSGTPRSSCICLLPTYQGSSLAR